MIIRRAFVSELDAYMWANAAEYVGGMVISITYVPPTTITFASYAGWRVFARVDNIHVTRTTVDMQYERLASDIEYRREFEAH